LSELTCRREPAVAVIRIAVGGDSYLVRRGIERIMADDSGIEVVASCRGVDELRAAVAELEPDAIVTTEDGVDLANELRSHRPDVGIVVLGRQPNALHANALLADGARGRAYLLEDRIADGSALTQIVRRVAAGGMHVDPAVVDVVVARADGKLGDPLSRLTPRELDVLSLLAGGDTNGVIAERLSISKRAVERHVNSIFAKLELDDSEHVSRRVKAALLFLQRQHQAQ
jgi:DNA-binding NarL/FixJ family response regulator